MCLAGGILPNPFTDRKLKCASCSEEFTFTAGEQIFFDLKKFVNDPKYCRQCKAKRAGKKTHPQTQTVCAECGIDTTVPFLPSQGRPVLCRACFDRKQPIKDAAAEVNELLPLKQELDDRQERATTGKDQSPHGKSQRNEDLSISR
jgi:CxxC-x17-CxxC domain-containing protein